MYKGNIYTLYNCDKKRSSIEKYDSLFSNTPKDVLERLELKQITTDDLEILWKVLTSSNRYSPIFRFLLGLNTDSSFEEALIMFCENIPPKEEAKGKVLEEEKGTSIAIRLPYVE